MTLTNFCETPRTMVEIEAEGFTRDQVYGAVKRGELVNQNRKDAWGRIKRGELVNQNRKDAWGRIKRGAGLFTVACPAPRYDAAPLVAAWR